MIDKITQASYWLVAQVPAPTKDNFKLPDIQATDGNAVKLLNFILGTVAALTILIIIIGAFNIVTGNGDPEKITRGKKAVIYALLGLGIVVTAEAIVLLVVGGLGS